MADSDRWAVCDASGLEPLLLCFAALLCPAWCTQLLAVPLCCLCVAVLVATKGEPSRLCHEAYAEVTKTAVRRVSVGGWLQNKANLHSLPC